MLKLTQHTKESKIKKLFVSLFYGLLAGFCILLTAGYKGLLTPLQQAYAMSIPIWFTQGWSVFRYLIVDGEFKKMYLYDLIVDVNMSFLSVF